MSTLGVESVPPRAPPQDQILEAIGRALADRAGDACEIPPGPRE